MSVFGAYVLKTWCVHLLQVHGVNMQLGELGIGGCVASNLGRARGREAERERRRAGQRQRGKLLLWESSASASVDK